MADRTTAPWNREEAGILAEGIVETVRQPLLILNRDLRVRFANATFYKTFKVAPAETEGRMIYELGNNQWDIPRLRELLSEVLPERQTVEDFEVQHVFESIGEKIMLLSARRLKRAGDRPTLILVAIEDVTERRRAERERELLLGELNHRVKNLFAVFRALVTQGNRVRSAADARHVLLGRMDALARTHDLLLESDWQSADLRSVARALQPFAGEHNQAIEIEGAPVRLDARQALSVSLVLHELATNAAKYGALSVPEGRVRLSWQVEPANDGRHLRLLWQERGGPSVSAPRKRGFGTELIRRAFGFELGGVADLAFEPEGVRLEATFPVA